MLRGFLRNIAGADDNAGRVQAVYARYAMKDRYLTKPLTGNPHQDMEVRAPSQRAGWRKLTSVRTYREPRGKENESAEE
jgi:hypothetical protein